MSKIKNSQQLISVYESMDEQSRQSLSDFADFLYERSTPVVKQVPPPKEIPRPPQETVVGAIKRLKSSYHMVENMAVFSAASSLMTDHMVKGRELDEVVEEMEKLFEEAYRKMLQDNE